MQPDELREQRLAESLEAIKHAEALQKNPVLSKALDRMEADSLSQLNTVDIRDQFAMVQAVINWRKSNAIRGVIDDLCNSKERVMAEIEQLNKQEL